MKKLTKVLSMVLLIAMCMSTFGGSAFAANHNCADYVVWNERENGVVNEPIEAVYPGCTAEGTYEHYKCGKPSCNKVYEDQACTKPLKSVVWPALGHTDFTHHNAIEPTCYEFGYIEHQTCGRCGKNIAMDGKTILDSVTVDKIDHEWVEDSRTPATEDATGNIHYVCKNASKGCDATYDEPIDKLPPSVPAFSVTPVGSTTYESADDIFRFEVSDSSYVVNKVTADGKTISHETTSSGRIIIEGSELSSINKPSIELIFYTETGESYRGIIISKPDKLEVEDLQVTYLTQNKYVKGTDKAVSFQTTDPNPDNIVIVSNNTQLVVPEWGYTFKAAVGDKYTYKFSNDYLDSLDCGSYQIRCYYGTSNDQYKTPGTLTINDPATTVDNSLSYTNGTQGDDTYFKYVSGDAVPRLCSELFRMSSAKLQVSGNGGKSWSNVSVYNYYVEQSNGKDSSYAWLKDTYLDSLDPDTIYYFRVVVPASSSSADITSNPVSLTTGPTLKAIDTAKHVINSSKNLKFTCSEKIAKVYVGNIELTDEDDFYISSNGKTVTLTPEFLNKRTAGSTYTIKVLTEDGEYASTTFQILTTAQASASPRTGDDSNIGLWAAFLLVSGAAAVAVLPKLRKEN